RPAAARSRKRTAVERADPDEVPDRRIKDAAPLAALIGLFLVARKEPGKFKDWDDPSKTLEAKRAELRKWLWNDETSSGKAQDIAREAVAELTREILPSVDELRQLRSVPSEWATAWAGMDGGQPPDLIERVFLNREASLSAAEGICTIKAD